MNNNKKYIKLQYNDYGYEIYVISRNNKLRLNKKDKMIMHKILKKFRRIKADDHTFIYSNYRLITLYFIKEKLQSKPKKVNRHKSKQIISGILLVTTLISGIKNLEIKTTDEGNEKSSITIELPEENTSKYDNGNAIIENLENPNKQNQEYNNSSIHKPMKNFFQYIEFDDTTNNVEEIENVNEFNYEYATPNDKEALANAEQYMEVFKKYEKIYGVDANLLCAIGAQESSGIHHKESKNGGYATGLMGIEYIWDGGEIRVFNFENNCYETIVVDYSRIGELDYNIKIGAAIFQNYFYSTLKNSNNVEETDYLAFTLQKYNMGPGNMGKVLSYGSNWIDNRDMIKAGDKRYFEHVLSRLDNDTIIRIRLQDGSYHETKVINTALEKSYSRN